MELMMWKVSYETGHAKLDEQHKGLLATFERMQHALVDEGDGGDAMELLAELKARTAEHFRTEDELMERFLYPEEEDHKGIHGRLIAQIEELYRRVEVGQTAMTPPVVKFLESWLTDHIQGEDFRLAEFLIAKGNQA
ncbi:MAG: bacteriohemerythrin [Firmicutes bacterium]|nr:bacteriohemerythrin [Bacillota bacterium]